MTSTHPTTTRRVYDEQVMGRPMIGDIAWDDSDPANPGWVEWTGHPDVDVDGAGWQPYDD